MPHPSKPSRSKLLRLALLGALCILLLFGAVWVGPDLEGERGDFILWQLRIPRVLVGILVGSTLSLVGAVYQALFNNPLATPSTVGTTAGATLGVLFALVFGLGIESALVPVTAISAFVGALVATWLVAAVASSGRASLHDVLLSGIAITLTASALSTAIQYLADMQALFAAAQWSLGQLPQVGYDGLVLMLPLLLAANGILLLQSRALQAVALGEESALCQGVAIRRLRAITLGAAALGVGTTVAWCGPIAFVGLIVPHLVKQVLGSSVRVVLPGSCLLGAAFLVTCDAVARSLFRNHELPVGVVTAALGAPALLLLIVRRR